MIKVFSAVLASVVFGIFTSAAAQAATVVIEENNCVTTAPLNVHNSITAYETYRSLPGATYELKIPPFGTMPLLTMIKSQARYTPKIEKGTDALVWVVLQPTNITDAGFYPKFLLRCTSKIESSTQFSHACNLVKEKLHYGLDDFQSTLTVSQGHCPTGQSELLYRLVMESNDGDVAAIKAKAMEPYGALGYLIGRLFDEQKFFRDYYLNFYQGWVKSLSQQ